MKRISRRNFLKAMGISATALTLAACGGSSSSTAAGTAGSTAASAVATGEPKAGGTLRLCYSSPIATPGYTPRATGNAAIYYLTLSYESLTSYDAEGNMIPNLATEWDVNTDELSITWTLREGVNFADGEPFNAEAVKRNIEEYQANNRTETANIASCEVIDDTHIKMMMAEPNSSTLESVGFFVYYMSPKALENPSSLDAATCGTGPFQLTHQLLPCRSARRRQSAVLCAGVCGHPVAQVGTGEGTDAVAALEGDASFAGHCRDQRGHLHHPILHQRLGRAAARRVPERPEGHPLPLVGGAHPQPVDAAIPAVAEL